MACEYLCKTCEKERGSLTPSMFSSSAPVCAKCGEKMEKVLYPPGIFHETKSFRDALGEQKLKQKHDADYKAERAKRWQSLKQDLM